MPYINGNKMKEIRDNKEISQKHVSEITGIAQAYLSNYETGRMKRAKKEDINKIASALKVAPEDLIATQDEPTSNQESKDWVEELKDSIDESNSLQDIEKIELEIEMMQHMLEAKKIEIQIYRKES